MVKKILIVDDEEPARSRLSRLIKEINQSFEIELAKNGLEALDCIRSKNPDIVFLDIQMPGMTGLEVLSQIRDRNFKIIFQTAYDEYALQAFEENACDYLLKPIEKDRLLVALEKAMKLQSFEDKLSELEGQFHKKGQFLENICVKKGNKFLTINAENIVCFSSQDHYTFVYTQSDEYIIDLPLSHLEERLNPNSFFRCHRSHIVNLERVESLNLGAAMKVTMDNESRVPVSRQNRKKMRALMQDK